MNFRIRGGTLKQLPPKKVMENAFMTRDAAYDGLFFVGVTSTGIFCRPSCPARKPNRENVEYFRAPGDALTAGFRPCRRCRPLESYGELPAWAKELIGQIEENPSIRITEAELRRSGLEPATVRRFFLRTFGVTFQSYCRSQRLSKAFDGIKKGGSMDDAAIDVGYESLSGFREAFHKKFNLPPGKSRGNDYIRMAWVETPIGPMIAGATAAGICLLEFTERRIIEDQMNRISSLLSSSLVLVEHPLHHRLQQELDEYFQGRRTGFSLPLVYPGSEFQMRVWQALLRIPYGKTRSYEAIAREIGSPGSMRAVGHANGLNRISILIPCHRVVNKNGSLGGYGGGLCRKRHLLNLENPRTPE
jgi:AraC family transcriptional regulator of adaptative response/methylated-DNA-[protein]-cysteine methyltransferase